MQFTTILAATLFAISTSAATLATRAPIEARTVGFSHSKRAFELTAEIAAMEKRGQSAACTICTFGCGTGGDLEACDCCAEGGACRDDGSCNI
ncbi:hypothetical protein COCC4DRAFT_51274 [Bipolaris maydis ATCC 48331]|uniref:Uncharacterized protein n=2 Tax=Cochliobolus heterostrophus TaxID=5016 RepID=M2TKS2_COCH5|nr:uncharacterized protein COCC4DRAFT_51274 [Bipolaris maydis ATCC 48331]EMD87099.1 hypothetical protein COCHEDRAFT_1185557 [Bipolaris maydis C5]KAJ5021583.1 hypothetical protein J3E73DRAFT_385730 [Bipolaris maydis]ENI03907.1 hypothetical protein COCC4DRAFT_51274 [Bipolaris maydis ATCC 48331]KAJ5055775.1 hypothetical protein J3E74DRAFT_422285 [Bipolaris maydis]KAJ6192859.1 hypothetical protein J3E72DRAFT_407337 [Bipolaris maydis]